MLERLRTSKLGRFYGIFASIFGSFWLFWETLAFFFPNRFNFGAWGYVGLVGISLMIALVRSLPKKIIVHQLAGSDDTITIKIGDLFAERGHLVIGLNDVFDTEIGDIISNTSVQAQFLQTVYQGNRQQLDADIEQQLTAHTSKGVTDPSKKRGRNIRYPIGTTLALRGSGRIYYLVAYGKMGADLRVIATGNDIWQSLQQLWEAMRLSAHLKEVAMPVIGTELARTGLPCMTMIELILTSYIAAAKQQRITSNLVIVISRRNADQVDMDELEAFLRSTRM